MDTIDALNDEIEVSTPDTEIKSETAPEEEVDPVQAAIAALRADIDKEYGHLKGFNPDAVKANLGRIPALQSAVDELKKGNLTASVMERLDLSDRALTAFATLMVNDTEQNESFKAPYREYLSGMDKARTQAQEDRLRQRLLDEMKPAAESDAGGSPDPWVVASTKVLARAQRAGVDPASIPFADIQREANGDPTEAVALAVEWITEHKPDPSAARVAERRRSAGNGSPSREGGGNTIERTLERLSTTGIPIEDEAGRKAAAEALGITL